jgi:hypothetical protein
MNFSPLTPRYIAEELDDAWHVFAARPDREQRRHVHGPLDEFLAKRIAADLNYNQELREEALRDECWGRALKC